MELSPFDYPLNRICMSYRELCTAFLLSYATGWAQRNESDRPPIVRSHQGQVWCN